MTDDTIEGGVPMLKELELGDVRGHRGWVAMFVTAQHGDGRIEHMVCALSRKQLDALGRQLTGKASRIPDAAEDHAPWRPTDFV